MRRAAPWVELGQVFRSKRSAFEAANVRVSERLLIPAPGGSTVEALTTTWAARFSRYLRRVKTGVFE
jgi:hypothetical protein